MENLDILYEIKRKKLILHSIFLISQYYSVVNPPNFVVLCMISFATPDLQYQILSYGCILSEIMLVL